jgi:hypothetical protein
MKQFFSIVFVALVLILILWRTFGSNQQETAPIQPPPPTAQAQVRPPVPTQAPEQKTEPAEAPKQPVKYDPNYRPPAVSDPKLAPLVNRYAENRVKTDMFNRYPEAKPEDFPALLTVLSDTKDGDTERHEVAELLRRSQCPELHATLFKILDNPDETARFRGFVMQYLGMMALEAAEDSDDRQTLVTRTRDALTDEHFEVRAQALQNLCRLKDPVGIETAVKWLTYKSADDFERGYILNQAIRCVGDLDLKENLPTIRKYARDPNNTVRIAAIVVLSNWNDVESLPAMQEAAEAKDPLVKKCGQEALKRMQPK